MTEPLRAPLTPSDCDISDFPFMPVEIARLFGSEFHANASDAEWRAGVTLWLKSYHQVPAASLPKDDVSLARLAEFGRDIKGWSRVRQGALRNWIECSDGRLYHEVVAEKALEAWIEKLGQRKSSGAGNAKRWDVEFDPSAIEEAIGAAAALLRNLNPQSRVLKKLKPKTVNGSPGGTAKPPPGNPDGMRKHANGSPDRVPPGSQEKGREGNKANHTHLSSASAREAGLPIEKVCEALGVRLEADTKRLNWPSILARMLEQGLDLEIDILPACSEARSRGIANLEWVRKRAEGQRSERVLREQQASSEDAKAAHHERIEWLKDYAFRGGWAKNTSGNGAWSDVQGVGPPPHDPRTLVTDDDLDRVPGARERRDKLRAA